MSKPLVIIPTFNEAKNITTLIESLVSFDTDVLVVDDNSPDGTSKIVKKICRQFPERVYLMSREGGKSGRGSAVLDGFSWALDNPEYDPIFEMDADFSHDPTELPRFLEAIEKADVVVGSRYLKESQILNWPAKRRTFSFLANKLSRVVSPVKLSDYTNGYRCYRRHAIEKLDFQKIPEKGYIVLSYVAAQLFAKGCSFAEVSTRFVNRKRGESQFSLSEVGQALRGILKLRFYG